MAAALALPPIAAAWGLRGGLVALACGCVVAAFAGLSGLREAPEIDEELGDLAHPLKDIRIWRLSIGSGLIAAPPLFAAVVAASSWGVGFGLAALFPLAGLAVLRRLAI
jgi:hypothetical protein